MDCESYEIAIEQMQRGELDLQDSERLRLHVSVCKSCASFHTFVQHMEETMQIQTICALRKLDWTAISMGIRHWRGTLRSGLWKGVATGLVTVPLSVVLLRDHGVLTATVAATSALVAVLLLGQARQKQLLAELAEAEQSQDELLNVYRDQLDREIATKKKDSRIVPLLAALPLLLLDIQVPANIVAVAALMALLLAIGLRTRFIILPQLIRHRKALS